MQKKAVADNCAFEGLKNEKSKPVKTANKNKP